MDVVKLLAPYFERYVTLERVHPTKTYNYKARGFFDWPVIEITMHRPKCSTSSWLYIAAPFGADLAKLEPTEKLYVGSQTADRMFRGDGMDGLNFHHAQMRSGNGDDTPVNYLNAGGRVDLYRMAEPSMKRALAEVSSFAQIAAPLAAMTTKHLGYWLEHVILAKDTKQWRWNTAAANRAVIRLVTAG